MLWGAAAAFGVLAGVSLVAGLVARRLLSVAAMCACVLSCLGAAWSAAGLANRYGTIAAAVAGVVFAAACCLAGYRLASSVLLDILTRSEARRRPKAASTTGRLAILLADAEPRSYSPHLLAARLKRIELTGAATLSSGVLPLVFFAERMRYRALQGPHPARMVVEAVADAVRERLSQAGCSCDVAVAYVDSQPDVADVVARTGPADEICLVDLGAAGSLPYLEARETEEQSTDRGTVLRVCAPSVWRDIRLATRLCERIIDRVPSDTRQSTGVVLMGSGVPHEWHRRNASWLEDETYFLTRVTMLLQEAGFLPHAVRHAWMNWQEPDLAESLRHLAAVGCTWIVVCPATILYPDLTMILDTNRDVRAARLPEHVQVTVMPPWDDDEVLVKVVASRVAEAFGLGPIEG